MPPRHLQPLWVRISLWAIPGLRHGEQQAFTFAGRTIDIFTIHRVHKRQTPRVLQRDKIHIFNNSDHVKSKRSHLRLELGQW
jgi:hypothetical protein